MSANPHVVTTDTVILWDHAPQRLGRGTIIDVPPDSPLLAAIGRDKLIPLYGAPPVTVPLVSEPAPESAASVPAPAPAPEAAQEKEKAPRSPAKTAAAAKGGKDEDPPDAGGGDGA